MTQQNHLPFPRPSYLLAFVLGLLLFVLGAQHAYAFSPIFVKPGSSGTADGSSWDNATTLHQAVTIATAGDEIWVATGIYTPGITANDTFSLTSGVALYGGFAATETLRTQRDWLANPTILSGDIGGDDQTDANGVVTDTANISGTNSLHVVKADGATTPITGTTVLDGFTIAAGDAVSGDLIDNFGGGFLCNIVDGAICSPHLENLTFTGNRADDSGGALADYGEHGGESSPSLLNVVFSGNTATNKGGAMYNDGDGGESSPSLVNVIFSGNHADVGGAMFNSGNSGAGSPTLVNVAFSSNVAENNGGAVFSTGAGSNPSFVNVTFSGNSAPNGGAVYNNGGRSVRSKISFVNVILWGNSATITGTQMVNRVADVTFTSSLVQGGITGPGVVKTTSIITDGGGNIDGDPLFVDAAHDDLRLNLASPAIDAGDNSAITYTTDLQGNPRKTDGDGNGTAVVDMGALEAPASYAVNVAKAGNGTGTVSKQPNQPSYLVGALVTLTATAATTSTFGGWTGACTGPNPCVVTIDESNDVTATFSLNSYPIAITTSGSGSGNVNKAPNQANYLFGSTVTLTAIPATGSAFSGWSGDCVGTAPCHLTINESNDVTAAFSLNSYPINLHNGGNGSGTVAKQPNQANYLFGSTVTLTATAATGSSFAGWSGACTGPNPCVVTIGTANDVTATFTLNSYSITVHNSGNGSGTVSKAPNQANYHFGSTVTLTATAATGSTFSGWSGDCTGPNPCVVTIDTANDVTATFSLESGPGNHAPAFTSTPGLTATVGVPYTYSVIALDPDSGDILTITAPTKPVWLTLTSASNGTATLSGTPTAANAGANAVQLRVQDQADTSATQNFTITVVVANEPITQTGNVQGKVVDEQGNGIAGAEVTLTSDSGILAITTILTETTGSQGDYLFENVPAGNYTLTIHLDGKDGPAPQAVTLQAGQTVIVPDITLQPSKALLHLPVVSSQQ